ncbi:hypothetical protein EXIGLDRAFT_771519 [Exidia glandulosa HHB12029]|uniref:F-box domain-containing protein n=1 Tax=Exidia glandulosa HHB12029 TaxID=1314781 RepID=A0A165FY11_EXIGL|nr:hypothetical protein EXIGLDRAFT_771519 [Exidia glandulosa HHB12029]
MPSLVDLAIQLNPVSDLTPDTVTAPVLFHLRRLELQCIFYGWLRLLAHSGTSLRDLILCNFRGAYRHNPDDGNLDVLRSVTGMRLDDVLDPTLVRASPNLHTLDLITCDSKLDHTIPCLNSAPPTLRHLILRVEESVSGFEVRNAIDLFVSRHPAMARLRHLALYPRLDWGYIISVNIDQEGRDARSILQTLCRERRIALSLFP